ncbi:MAG TPA: recombinase family protein [Leptolyngbyaceae cyanobacterium]
MLSDSIWIIGSSRSGKTTRLVDRFCRWVESESHILKKSSIRRQIHSGSESIPQRLHTQASVPAVLVLAANDDNRRELADSIVTATGGKYPIRAKTPLGFFQDEVILFWPLLIGVLNLKAQFPVRLRPETEQELATLLWHQQLDEEILLPIGISESRLVRRLLDIFQLAAYSGTPIEEIASVLAAMEAGGAEGAEGETLIQNHATSSTWGDCSERVATKSKIQNLHTLLLQWRNWCWERGFLTYGITTELYYRHLLPNPYYQQYLTQRFRLVLADDVDDYPAIARDLFEFLLDQGAVGAFTYNSDSAARLGLGADPNYLKKLSQRCVIETLSQHSSSLAETLAEPVVESVTQPMVLLNLPESVQTLQTTSRADLLRQTAKLIIQAVQSKEVQPQEIAVIAPGLDAIARYTLVEILSKQGIPVESLNDQRPLISSPIIRALLTLLALVYPGLGRLVDRDAVAEMLVVLSTKQEVRGTRQEGELSVGSIDLEANEKSNLSPLTSHLLPLIDPVRAGLIADYCFEPHPDRPNLLPVTAYDRWDRLGYAATAAYGQIVEWIEQQRSHWQQRLLPSPILLLDRAIQKFLWNGSNLPYDQLAALRELLETAQHYWEVNTRLQQIEHSQLEFSNENITPHATIAQFIQLLRRGAITANPYPVRPIGPASRAVTLATIFQYRSSRRFHRWQFWLDAGSPLWLSGGAATLYGAPLFLQHRYGKPWTAEEEMNANDERLGRILRDLLGRVGERVYLCHSELAVNGQEQNGPLLPLVNAAVPIASESVLV